VQVEEKFKSGKEIIHPGGMIIFVPLIQSDRFNNDSNKKKCREIPQIRKFPHYLKVYEACDQASDDGIII